MSDLWKVCARGSAPLRGFNILLVLYVFYNVFIICRCYFSFVFLCCVLGLRPIYIYGISDASAPRSAPTFFLISIAELIDLVLETARERFEAGAGQVGKAGLQRPGVPFPLQVVHCRRLDGVSCPYAGSHFPRSRST